jgi:hypothetical protein
MHAHLHDLIKVMDQHGIRKKDAMKPIMGQNSRHSGMGRSEDQLTVMFSGELCASLPTIAWVILRSSCEALTNDSS